MFVVTQSYDIIEVPDGTWNAQKGLRQNKYSAMIGCSSYSDAVTTLKERISEELIRVDKERAALNSYQKELKTKLDSYASTS